MGLWGVCFQESSIGTKSGHLLSGLNQWSILGEHEREALKKQVVALEWEKSKAEEERKMADDKREKALARLAELVALKSKVADLEKPFWKKWFT